MDVNGLPFRMLSERADFGLSAKTAEGRAASGLAFRDATGHVCLARQQPVPALAEHELFARRMIGTASPVMDPGGSFAWVAGGRIRASGFRPGDVELDVELAAGPPPDDMALGADDILYVAQQGSVLLHDLRGRFADALAARDDFSAHLLAPLPGGGAWAFDRGRRRLAVVRGRPLRQFGLSDPAPTRFGRVEPNPDPPRLEMLGAAALGAALDVVAIAASPGGALAMLAWEAGEMALLLTFEAGRFVPRFRLAGLRFPYALAFVDATNVAVLASNGAAPAAQAFVYPVDAAPTPERALPPDGRIFPLREPWAGKFANGLLKTAHYPTAATAAPAPARMRPLHALSGGRHARSGEVMIGPIDGGADGCVWHRLYAEAALPDGCAIDLYLHASDIPTLPAGPDVAWARHRLLPAPRAETPAAVPVGAWLAAPSEVPFAAPRLRCPAKPGRAGLFTLLLQHGGRRVRRIRGRHLWIRMELSGNGRTTPEIAACRVYGGRLSWRDRYLPGFYTEMLSGDDAVSSGPATASDFLERLLHTHEGVLTELEGRIAESWQMSEPATAPDAALPWLGRWIGVGALSGEAPQRLRQRLAAAPFTARLNGTAGGLRAALELATGGHVIRGGTLDRAGAAPRPGDLALAATGDDRTRMLMLGEVPGEGCVCLAGGAVSKGEIVVVEGFRLRRTFATILGADLADEDDPLTMGLATSGNSFVGDTLILGDEARDELLALFRSEIDAAAADTAAVRAFYERLAFRVLVLVRGGPDRTEMQRLSECAAAAAPAHVEVTCHPAHDPLIVGAASLVGIDTFLEKKALPRPFRIGESGVGMGDLVHGSGYLDPRADGPASWPPAAAIDGPREVWRGSSFTLSALRSRATPGRQLTRHIWTFEEEN